MDELPRRAGKFAYMQGILEALITLHPHGFTFCPLTYVPVFPFTFSFKIAAGHTKPVGNLLVIAEAAHRLTHIVQA